MIKVEGVADVVEAAGSAIVYCSMIYYTMTLYDSCTIPCYAIL